mmetsp:Transcript_73148/g.115764  ORF Transcript_73148/g.115764 Transcript_73148/m.115764 type:complete len:203 (-) Transcript_73148:22-630(-)
MMLTLPGGPPRIGSFRLPMHASLPSIFQSRSSGSFRHKHLSQYPRRTVLPLSFASAQDCLHARVSSARVCLCVTLLACSTLPKRRSAFLSYQLALLLAHLDLCCDRHTCLALGCTCLRRRVASGSPSCPLLFAGSDLRTSASNHQPYLLSAYETLTPFAPPPIYVIFHLSLSSTLCVVFVLRELRFQAIPSNFAQIQLVLSS